MVPVDECSRFECKVEFRPSKLLDTGPMIPEFKVVSRRCTPVGIVVGPECCTASSDIVRIVPSPVIRRISTPPAANNEVDLVFVVSILVLIPGLAEVVPQSPI